MKKVSKSAASQVPVTQESAAKSPATRKSAKNASPKHESTKKASPKKASAQKKSSSSTSQIVKQKAAQSSPLSRKKRKPLVATSKKVAPIGPLPSITFVASSLVEGQAYKPGMPFRLERLITPVEVGLEYAARRKELDAEFDRARKALRKVRPTLQKRKDFLDGSITGVSVRFRTKFGQVVSPLQVAIVINVNRKRTEKELERLGYEKFEAIEGVRVKIVEGSFSLLNESASFLKGLASPKTPISFLDPIVGGAAIAPSGNPLAFGTLGVVAVSVDNKCFGISCQHVVSNSADQIDTDGSTRLIGNVITSRPPNKDFEKGTTTESLDCSLLEFIKNSANPIAIPSSGNWVHGYSGELYLAGRRVNSDELDKPIFKFGVGTGELVEGRIEALDRDVKINGVPYFNNYSVVLAEDSGRTFAVPGDSGSVLVVQGLVDGVTPAFIIIGVLFARLDGDNAVKVGIACNMSYVVDALKLKNTISGLKVAKNWTYS